MSRLSRQLRREEKDRAYQEREVAVGAQENAVKVQITAKQEEEAWALLNAGPEALALMAAKELIKSKNDVTKTVHQENAYYNRSIALSNLAILSAIGGIAGQPEQ